MAAAASRKVSRTDSCGGVSGADGCGGLTGGADGFAGGLAGDADGRTWGLAGDADGRAVASRAGTEERREKYFFIAYGRSIALRTTLAIDSSVLSSTMFRSVYKE